MISAEVGAFKRPAEGILIFWRKECLSTGVLNPPLPLGPIVTDNSLAPPIEGCCLQAIYRPCPVLSESTSSGGVGRTIVAGGPLVSPQSPRPKCNVHGVQELHLLTSTNACVFYVSMYVCMCMYIILKSDVQKTYVRITY